MERDGPAVRLDIPSWTEWIPNGGGGELENMVGWLNMRNLQTWMNSVYGGSMRKVG